MKGANINAAATGLMQGIQYMDERNRRIKQDERQARLDSLAEQREARRAELDGLTLQKTQMEMADYEADKPLREGERVQKLQKMEQEQEQAALMDRLAEAMARDDMTGSLDGRIGMLNELGADFGTQVKGGTRDPKTGKLTLTFTSADGQERVGEYNSIDDLDDDILMLSDKTYRAKALQARQTTKAESAKEEREHQRKLKEIEAQGKNSANVARINQEGRMDLLEFKRDFESRNGTGRVLSMADRGKLTIEWAGEIGKTREGKKMTPEALLAAAKRQVDSLYGDSSPAPAAAAGVNLPKPGNAPASGNTPSVVIPLDRYLR